MFENFLYAISVVFLWENIVLIIVGTAIGMVFGALPGLTVTLAVTLVLPFTFDLSPESGIILLTGVYCSGTYAGSISAILINTPGTPSSAATAWDGYPLTQKGRSLEALSVGLHASVIGGLISAVALIFFAPMLAKTALAFGPPERFALTFFGLTIIARVSGVSLSKGLISALFGLLIASVGVDPIMGVPRFSFNTFYLYGGVGMIEVFIGIFAIAEIFNQIGKRAVMAQHSKSDSQTKTIRWKEIVPHYWTVVKSSVIGIIIGVVPGTGGSIASFIAYDEAKRSSKEPELFGKGSLEGIAAAESANNGVTAATLIPTLTLGIPGNTVAAIFLGALLIHGLTPGPQLFVNQGGLMYTIMVSFIMANIVMYFQGRLALKWFDKIVNIPSSILLPIILTMCLVGAYTISNSLNGVIVALIFGCVGYAMIKFEYPSAPMVIAIILGGMVEESMRQSLILSDGSPMIFLTRPLSLAFFVLTIFVTFSPMVIKQWKKRRNGGGQA
ncbi:C4-dicarboxylate ABC transporter permease [Leucothrix arctica]|uniref:C4-dicarboxylate ABC transporter permease n=1 Tax=Leucothrix arctica TaxID=1481894 RepID=A0A317CQ61_9GAMM|nr:C4-dicarboxylate ABC transporter permease [Leucothrix arctica]